MDLAKIRKKARASSKEDREDKRPPAGRRGGKQSTAKSAERARKKTASSKKENQELTLDRPKEKFKPADAAKAEPALDENPPAEEQNPLPDMAAARHLEKLLLFSLGKRKYAISITEISQIVPERTLTPIPHVPSFVKGVFSLRGKVVSVLEVAGRLGLKIPKHQVEGKIIVLDASTDLFGLRVDSIDQVMEVDVESLEPPPEAKQTQEQEMVEGVFHHQGKTVAYLNLPMLLSFDVSEAG
ncbi:MAG: chemotaxis protein CheW [Acidobacteriota bacterium]